MAEKKTEFEPLEIKRKRSKDNNTRRYRVYKTPKEFVIIEAETVMQAIEVSGVQNPFKVLLENNDQHNVLVDGMLVPVEEVLIDATPEAATPEIKPEETLPDAPPETKPAE